MENKPIITQARKLVKKGYNVIPVNSEKEPAIRTWSVDKQVTLESVDLIFNRLTYGVALLMGGNKGLTALDFDLKYSPIPEELYKRFCDSIPQDLRDKMYIQKTSAVRFFANSADPYLLPTESMLISSTSKIRVE